ncbi:MAG TPA: Xaa-Pro dipeptidyl-peptidase [Jatrophihabitans sp.]|jgi:X-Pro dipeptidyl-peptidase
MRISVPFARFRTVVIGATAAALVVAAFLTPSVAAADPPSVASTNSAPGTESKPVYDYSQAIHESVRVKTGMDTDGDGATDTIAVDIIRPHEAAGAGGAGRKVPVIMDASPYFTCCGRGNESQVKTYDANGVIAQLPLYYDNYFVPRGYAVLGVDILGTGRSTGCGDLGGKNEIASITAVIDWLNGRNSATTLDGKPTVASWSTGAVGMIGKSYDGTLAEGVAATGIKGLKTIVPLSSIDSWYDYTRSNGVVYSDDYPSFLTGYVGRSDGVCDAYRRSLDVQADDATGNYNAFWAERDYLKNVSKVKASVFVSHGVNDLNVETRHFASWWAGLVANHVPRKMWLSQEGHVDAFDYSRAAWVDELHKWFDYWLLGLNNHVMSEPAVMVERSPNTFVAEQSWPAAPRASTVSIGAGGLGSKGRGALTVGDNADLTEKQIIANPDSPVAGRLMFSSAPLTKDIRISGTPTATLRISANRTDTPVSARLIDYGPSQRPVGEGVQNSDTTSCWGFSGPVDSACYLDVVHHFTSSPASVISRGWLDAAHSTSIAHPQPLVPGKWRTVTIPLRAQDDLIAKGHRVALAITLSDNEFTTPNSTGAEVSVDLGLSSLSLPVVGHLQLTAAQASTSALGSGQRLGLTVASEGRVPGF